MYEKTFPNKRFKHTLEFLQKHIATSETIFDLGVNFSIFVIGRFGELSIVTLIPNEKYI